MYGTFLATLNHTINDDINGSITLGQNFSERNFSDLFTRGRNLGIDKFYNLKNATSFYSSQSQEIIRTSALFFTADASYKNLVYLNVTGRNEWASTFGSNAVTE